jgi:RNA polymerase sigma-70 factor (ECF subfamily)
VRRVARRARDAAPWPPPDAPPPLRDFEALTLPHAAALYRTAYHLTGSAVEAEDLTQETYLRAFRSFAGFRDGDVRAWLFAILRHAFIDDYRKRGRSPTVAPDIDIDEEGALAGSGMVTAWAPSAESEALRSLPSEAIERAFAALPPEWRMVVMLADVEELSYREIADVMDVPLGTVMSRLHRARKRLQEHLRDAPRSGWSQKRSERSA